MARVVPYSTSTPGLREGCTYSEHINFPITTALWFSNPFVGIKTSSTSKTRKPVKGDIAHDWYLLKININNGLCILDQLIVKRSIDLAIDMIKLKTYIKQN